MLRDKKIGALYNHFIDITTNNRKLVETIMYAFLSFFVYTRNETIHLEKNYFYVDIHDDIYDEKPSTKCSRNMTLTMKFLQVMHVHKQSCHPLKQRR